MADGERKGEPDEDDRADCLRFIVHDLNNPLTAIRILAEMCREQVADPEVRHDMVDLLEAADYATALLEGLSSLVRHERVADELTWSQVDLVEVLRDAADRPALRRHVQVVVPAELRIAGDRGALQRAFTEVLVNARKLADHQPAKVTVSETRAEVEIRVRHPAPAIPAELRDQLFEPYGAVKLRDAAVPVSAVGLVRAARTIRAHRGAMSFEDGPGGAMDLVIRLPR